MWRRGASQEARGHQAREERGRGEREELWRERGRRRKEKACDEGHTHSVSVVSVKAECGVCSTNTEKGKVASRSYREIYCVVRVV